MSDEQEKKKCWDKINERREKEKQRTYLCNNYWHRGYDGQSCCDRVKWGASVVTSYKKADLNWLLLGRHCSVAAAMTLEWSLSLVQLFVSIHLIVCHAHYMLSLTSHLFNYNNHPKIYRNRNYHHKFQFFFK